MVAAVCTWHEHHRAAVVTIEGRFQRGDRLAVAAHALVETYAVLTRLPAPHRLSPADAWTVIEANFVDQAVVVALNGAAHITLLRQLATEGVGGGRTYDAVIARSAVRARADVLLTFNSRHFDPPPHGVTVIEPTESS
jgi:predicted nucleic acid-binding protein